MDSETIKKSTETTVDDDGSSKTVKKEENTATGEDQKTTIKHTPEKTEVTTEDNS